LNIDFVYFTKNKSIIKASQFKKCTMEKTILNHRSKFLYDTAVHENFNHATFIILNTIIQKYCDNKKLKNLFMKLLINSKFVYYCVGKQFFYKYENKHNYEGENPFNYFFNIKSEIIFNRLDQMVDLFSQNTLNERTYCCSYDYLKDQDLLDKKWYLHGNFINYLNQLINETLEEFNYPINIELAEEIKKNLSYVKK